ncbi:hypothetical protein QJS66_05410 [Kocuria rhizophila]|nr:hypothetical protein QJS66_05410 [Kocuria rhizophila]
MITQSDYPRARAWGLIKMDFLGLRNLTIISDVLEHHAEPGRLDLEHLPIHDPGSYELLARGRPWACSSWTAGRCASCSSSCAGQLRGHRRPSPSPAGSYGRELPQLN